MKTGGMAKAKKYREGGTVGMKKPMPAATRSRARGDDKSPMDRQAMSAEQMRDRRESDAEMGNLGTEIGDMMRRRAAGFKKGGKVVAKKKGGMIKAKRMK